jgi:hypothetical protein
MAKRWTVAQAIDLAQRYRIAIATPDSAKSEEQATADAVTIREWWDMCRRAPNVGPLMYTLAEYPESNLFRYFNTSCSVRKLQTAIDQHKDFSTIQVSDEEEEDDEEETRQKPQRQPKAPHTPKPKIAATSESVNVQDLLDIEV